MFGQIIRTARLEKGMSALELSGLSGVAETTIYQIENERFMPGTATLFALARHIPVNIDTLAIELEKEKSRRRGTKPFPNLLRYLKNKNISIEQFAKIINRSKNYVSQRINSVAFAFTTDDIKLTIEHFNLYPNEAYNLFLTDVDNNLLAINDAELNARFIKNNQVVNFCHEIEKFSILYSPNQKAKWLYDYDATLRLLKRTTSTMENSLRCERPDDLPATMPWNEKPYVSRNNDDPYIYDGSMGEKEYIQMHKNIDVQAVSGGKVDG